MVYMFPIKPVCLAPILLFATQCAEQSCYRAALITEQVGQHVLSQFALMLFLRTLFGLLGNNGQDVLAQRAVFFSSGDGGASGRSRTIVRRS